MHGTEVLFFLGCLAAKVLKKRGGKFYSLLASSPPSVSVCLLVCLSFSLSLPLIRLAFTKILLYLHFNKTVCKTKLIPACQYVHFIPFSVFLVICGI